MPFWVKVFAGAWVFVFGSNFLRYQEGKIGLLRFIYNVTFRFFFVMFLIILGFLLLGLLCVVAGILWRRTHPRTSAPEA